MRISDWSSDVCSSDLDQGRLSWSPRCDGSMIEGVESMRGTASMDRKRNLIVGGGAVAALAGLYLLVADDRSGDAPALAQRAAAAPAQKRAKEIADKIGRAHV